MSYLSWMDLCCERVRWSAFGQLFGSRGLQASRSRLCQCSCTPMRTTCCPKLPQHALESTCYLINLSARSRRVAHIWVVACFAYTFPKVVDINAPPNFVLRQDRIGYTTDSWKLWAEAREVDEWIGGVAGVLEQGWNEQYATYSREGSNIPSDLSPSISRSGMP